MRDLPVGGDETDRRSALRFALTTVLAVALLVSLGGAAYVAVNPPETGTPYTELYVLNEQGVAADYPTNLSVGEEGTVLVGIANDEHETVEYELVVGTEQRTIERQSITLGDGESTERRVGYAFDEPGATVVRFQLYRGSASSDGEPYRQTRLIVNVTS